MLIILGYFTFPSIATSRAIFGPTWRRAISTTLARVKDGATILTFRWTRRAWGMRNTWPSSIKSSYRWHTRWLLFVVPFLIYLPFSDCMFVCVTWFLFRVCDHLCVRISFAVQPGTRHRVGGLRCRNGLPGGWTHWIAFISTHYCHTAVDCQEKVWLKYFVLTNENNSVSLFSSGKNEGFTCDVWPSDAGLELSSRWKSGSHSGGKINHSVVCLIDWLFIQVEVSIFLIPCKAIVVPVITTSSSCVSVSWI